MQLWGQTFGDMAVLGSSMLLLANPINESVLELLFKSVVVDTLRKHLFIFFQEKSHNIDSAAL